ncbi:MAG: hypothetical protein K8J31_01290, partial [Anaerolineae bacterium]|nr:hypothetical protein [Anaerolineae bacterium]
MTDTVLRVAKDSDLMRATFVATGLAHLVSTLVPQHDVHIRDVGTAFRLTTAATQREIEIGVQAQGLPQLLPAIRKPLTRMEQTRRDQGVPIEQLEQRYVPPGFPHDQIVDYAAERERWRAALRRSLDSSEDRPQPDPRFPFWAHLCSHFGLGSSMLRTYPLLVHLWFAHQGEAAVALCRLILDYFSGVGCDPSAAGPDTWLKQIRPQLHSPELKQFNWTATASQVSALAIISPTSIKGVNTASARQQPHNKTLKLFWLEAYLAFAGFLTLALPAYWQPTRRARKDVATYYPVPCDILFADLQALMDQVRGNPKLQAVYEMGSRLPRAYMDVWITLLLSEALYTIRTQSSNNAGARPGITELAACYYKD